MTTAENPTPASRTEPAGAGEVRNVATAPARPACPTCSTGPRVRSAPGMSGYVYALGRVEPRFPTLSTEKEFSQAVGRAETAKLTDREVLHAILTQRQNRYLARQLCWVLTIQGPDTYVLQSRDPADLDLLVEAIRPAPSPDDRDVVVGLRGGIAPPEMCNGFMVPVVLFDQIYSFDRDSLIKSIPRSEDVPEKEFRAAAAEVFDRIVQMAGNTGSSDEHRAVNYLVVRYPAIHARTAAAFAADRSLSAVDVRASALSGTRRIVEVIFSYTHRGTDVTEKNFVRIDVTDEFPFIVTTLSPYFDR